MKIFFKAMAAILILVVSLYVGSHFGAAHKETEMQNLEIRNILLAHHQLYSSIKNDMDTGESSDYLRGQIITLLYSGLHSNQSHSDIKGFMDYCLVALEEQSFSDLEDALNEAIAITEVLSLNSEPDQIRNVLTEYNQFLSSYPFPARTNL